MERLLTVEGLLTTEKVRGAVTSSITGSTAIGLNFVGVAALGLSAPLSALIFLYVGGGFLGYCFDILFAKRSFVTGSSGGSGGSKVRIPVPVPYDHLGRRARWLLRSFAHRSFYRFVVTLIIETLTSLAMLAALIRTMDSHRVLPHWRFRDATAAVLVGITNFLLFGNILRFDWAYNELDQPVMNFVVLAWMALVLVIFSQSTEPFEKSLIKREM
jgi:hypothetical protein